MAQRAPFYGPGRTNHVGGPSIAPIGWSGGAAVYGDGKAVSARKQLESAMRANNNSITDLNGTPIRRWDGRWVWGGTYSRDRVYPSRAKMIAAVVKGIGPRQAQEVAANYGIETRPTGRAPASGVWYNRDGSPWTGTARKAGKSGKTWAKGAVSHPGKLGGAGFTDRPAAERRSLLTRVVGDDGYSSAMSSLTFLLNVGKSTLTKAEKDRLQSDKLWLKKTWGNPGSTPSRGGGKATPKTGKGARKLAGDFSLRIHRVARGSSPSVETIEKGAYTGAEVRSDFPLRNLVARLTRGLGFCERVAKAAKAAIDDGKRVTLRHAGGRGDCVPASDQAITIHTGGGHWVKKGGRWVGGRR